MDPTNINQHLFILYESYLKDIRVIYSRETQTKLSLPLFMHVYYDYRVAEKRVMVIGQETYSWYSNLADASYDTAKIIEKYKAFELGKNYFSSPFCKFANGLYNKVNPGADRKGLLWTNLSRFDYCKKKVPHEINVKNILGFKLLQREIQLVRPDLVVFTTFWRRDKYIKIAFPDMKIEHVKGYKPNFLGSLKSEHLPKNTFRTYHPNYLNRQKDPMKKIDGVIKAIINEL